MAVKALAAFMICCSLTALQAQNLERVAISQVVVKPPTLEAYIDVRGKADTPVTGLQASAIQATLDGQPVPVSSMKLFSATGEGVAYVFLVDVSESESPAEFGKVKSALQAFIKHMDAKDQAAIITFGTGTDVAAGYTGDKAALDKVVSGLTNKAAMTHLNEGLEKGLTLARLKGAGLPSRRAIVILSDGKDEGSGLTTDDVLHNLQENRIPIYAIGASNLAKSERAQYLEVLHRYAVLSGGAYYEAVPDTVDTAYTQIHDRMARVWVAQLNCASCPASGRIVALQIQVTVQGQSLADQANVVVNAVAPPPAHAQPKKPWWKRLSWPVYAGGGAAILLLVILGIIFLRPKAKEEAEPPPPTAEPEIAFEPTAPPTTVPLISPFSTMPMISADPTVSLGGAGATVSLSGDSVILDNRPGTRIELMRRDQKSGVENSYSGKLVDRLIIGRSAAAGLRIPDQEVSGQHCELEMLDGRVLLTDLSSTYGTSINGVPVKVRQRLESGDLISLGRVEFRVKIYG